MANLEEGDIILCTVDRIVGTTVFVKIQTREGEIEGSIVFSEIAPGRIRNIREYVVPKKKIVCKVLRVSGGRIDLSLRRVTQKEQKELMEANNLEKSYKSVLKSILGDKTEETVKKINSNLYEFLEEAKKDSKELEKIAGKENAKKILDIIKSQKKKKAVVKKEFSLNTSDSEGLALIKSLLKKDSVEISYISAGKYSIKAESEDPKKAEKIIEEVLNSINSVAKTKQMTFSTSEK